MTETEKREAIRQFLGKRYNGVIPITDEMIDAVLAGLAEIEIQKEDAQCLCGRQIHRDTASLGTWVHDDTGAGWCDLEGFSGGYAAPATDEDRARRARFDPWDLSSMEWLASEADGPAVAKAERKPRRTK